MHIGAYEPTVMYFGLTNFSTIFQTIMNNLFWDLINQGDTITFIDDILVATNTEEGHDNERVQKEIAYWDKQNHAVPAPNCVLKVRGEIIKVEGL